jgi:Tol biopolymer transport system component
MSNTIRVGLVATLLALVTAGLWAQAPRGAAVLIREAQRLATIQGDLRGAAAKYDEAFAAAGADRVLAAQALFGSAMARERLGDVAGARSVYGRLIAGFADQGQLVTLARQRAAALQPATVPVATAAAQSGAIVEYQEVWTGEDVEFSGRPSRDGRYLTFLDRSLGRPNAAVRDLAAGTARLVTRYRETGACEVEWPVLSPDGQRVAYGCNTDLGASIWQVDVDGSNARRLATPAAVGLEAMAWSPDATRLAVVLRNEDRTTQIALVSVADGRITPLRSEGRGLPPWIGDFSPDGRWVVYSHAPGGGADSDRDVFAMAVDGTERHVIAGGPAVDKNPMWTPDGRHVVFVSDRSGANGVWAVRIEAGRPVGDPVVLRDDIGSIDSLGFSASGTFFYGLYFNERDVFTAEVDPANLRVIGSPTRVSGQHVGAAASPHWSPDGRSIAFLAGKVLGDQSVVIRNVETGVERVLPIHHRSGNFTTAYGFSWFPDSRAVLLRDDAPEREGRVVFRRVEVDTGRSTEVFEAGDWDAWPPVKLSPDGTTVFYTALARDTVRDINRLRLLKRSLVTGEETELYATETGFVSTYGLTVSPDSSRLAFLGRIGERPRTLLTLPTSGGTPTELYPSDGAAPLPVANVQNWRRTWTPDGRFLISNTADGGVWAFPTRQGDEPRKLEWPLPEVGELSPDGRHTVYRVDKQRRELRTIPNLLSRLLGPVQ